MSMDVEKSRLARLLDGLEVLEINLPEKCLPIVEEFRAKFGEDEFEVVKDFELEEYANPYKPDPAHLEAIDKKINQIISERKKLKRQLGPSMSCPDPKRPWRMNTGKEKLLRINNELKRHRDKSTDLIVPIADEELEALVKDVDKSCEVDPARIQETVESARRSLPNFQYRKNVTPIPCNEQLHEAYEALPDAQESGELSENEAGFKTEIE